MSFLLSTWGSIDVGSPWYQPYCTWVSSIKCRCCPPPPFCGSLLTPPHWADWSISSHCDWPKLVFFLKCSCILLTLLLWMANVASFDTICRIWLNTFNNDLLNGTIDGVRVKNKCCQKEGVALGISTSRACSCSCPSFSCGPHTKPRLAKWAPIFGKGPLGQDWLKLCVYS